MTKDSPAEKAGLQQGDIILKFNKLPVTDVGALRNSVAMIKPGTQAPMVILRKGKQLDLLAVVGDFPATGANATTAMKHAELGLHIENLTPEQANKLGYKESGVLISGVEATSPLAWAGVKKGALILQVNQQKVTNVEEFNEAMKAASKGKPILFLVKQGETTRYISIKLG